MGVIPKEKVQSTLEVEPMELPEVTDGETNYQYNEVKRAIKEFIDAYGLYIKCNDKLEEKKASLQKETDWSNIYPDRKPTVADKEAHITLVTMDQQVKAHELHLDKIYKEKLYELEVMRYEKE